MATELKHGFRIDLSKCTGKMECMRACPAQALRVRSGKAMLVPELCIDCGICLRVCPSGAISPTTVSFAQIEKYKHKVAIPSAVLYSQFPMSATPPKIRAALTKLGFDAVYDFSVEIELVNRAIRECISTWKGPFPLISSSCPVVVRLVQVAYPTMVGQLLPIELPRELAGLEVKRKYSKGLGIAEEEIAAVYITPCQAKTISIVQPAEGVKSYLDGAVGINEIYNDILVKIKEAEGEKSGASGRYLRSPQVLLWGMPEGQSANLPKQRVLSLTGIGNIIKVFDDIEKGKLRNVDYLECYTCEGGCTGGNLTVDNLYVARGKVLSLFSTATAPDEEFLQEVERRYPETDFSLKGPVRPRMVPEGSLGLIELLKRRKRTEEILAQLPGLNCGLCGAPRCRAHAEDVAFGRADARDCVFLSRDRINELREIYTRPDGSGRFMKKSADGPEGDGKPNPS